MLLIIDGLQFMWLAWNTKYGCDAALYTKPYEIFLTDYFETSVLNRDIEKIVVVWDNLVLPHVSGHEEDTVFVGVKSRPYIKQIKARIEILKHFIDPFFNFIKDEKDIVQIWSPRNTADDVMYMYIRNIQRNVDPSPSIAFIPNSKSLLGLVDIHTCAYIPETYVNGSKFKPQLIDCTNCEEILGCSPEIFMVRRALCGDFEENISPVPLSVELTDTVELLALRGVEARTPNFFNANDATEWFADLLKGAGVETVLAKTIQFQKNYSLICFLPVSQLYVQKPGRGQE